MNLCAYLVAHFCIIYVLNCKQYQQYLYLGNKLCSSTWPVCKVNFPQSERCKNTTTKDVLRKYLDGEKYIGVADQSWKTVQCYFLVIHKRNWQTVRYWGLNLGGNDILM